MLPEGTVSLLFSDMEGSTRLLSRLGSEYPAALDEQRRILRASWASHGGAELGTEGDSFYVVFPRAGDAVEASVAAQRELGCVAWPKAERVRVRMGIHTGSPLRHEDAYVGMDVHRAARIAAAAHGGQILVSDATAALLDLDGVGLRDLGRQALKDLGQPEHLFQVLADGLESRFPPLRSLGSVSNLPQPATALVGREQLLGVLAALAARPEARLVTLTGPGGSGKTRLAGALAEAVAEQHPDGVYFVALETVTSADGMWATIGAALNLPPEARVPPGLHEELAQRSALLVLDNLEQLADADLVVTDLLRVAPRLRVVATSRHPLHVAGEHEFPVPPLDLPGPGRSSPGEVLDDDEVEATRRAGAVAMFTAQVQLIRPEFRVDAANAAVVRLLCERLDGLPLALELAAARSRLLSPTALLARLDAALDFSSRERTRTTRQQTLRQTIRWSYDLLEDRQRRLFRLLGVFSGGSGVDAVQAVAAACGMDPDQVLDVLESLVEASLVNVTEGPDGEPRIVLLNTVAAFAAGELANAPEAEQVEAAAARHFSDLVVRYDEHGYYQDRGRWQAMLETDLDNLRRSLAWLLDPRHDAGTHDRLDNADRARVVTCGLSMELLVWRGYHEEAGQWCRRAMDAAPDITTPAAASCRLAIATVLGARGDHRLAMEHLDAARTVLLAAEPSDLIPAPFLNLLRTAVLSVSALTALSLGDSGSARRLAEQALGIPEGADAVKVHAVLAVAEVNAREGAHDQALRHREDARLRAQRAGSERAFIVAQHGMGASLQRLGRPAEALEALRSVTPRLIAQRDPRWLVEFAEQCAEVLLELGHTQAAARLVGAANTTRERLHIRRDPLNVVEAEAAVQRAREQYGTAWSEDEAAGRLQPLEQVLIDAISGPAHP